jgi:glutathione S-transferase
VGERPVLYSFRRCPYAIRARISLAWAGLQPGLHLEVREVDLKAKPPELLKASAKGTVPVLVLPTEEGCPEPTVLGESLEIMHWARSHQASSQASGLDGEDLIAENDGPFKHHLDRFRYGSRTPGDDPAWHRAEAMTILRRWNAHLEPGGWLLGGRPSLADLALLPFVRQFRLADPAGFDAEPGLAPLQGWLKRFLEGRELARVMEAGWAPRKSWRSPSWIYHLALAEEWRTVAADGGDADYRRSSRGLALEQVGFVHASGADQIETTFRRFYADAGEVLLLTIDPRRLQAAGVPVLWEPAPESGERFPHIHGALPVSAVLKAEPYRPS